MIWLLTLCCMTAVATAIWPDVTGSLIFSVCLFALLLRWLRKAIPLEDRAYLMRVIVVAFAVRLSCAYFVEALTLIQKSDALSYHVIGSGLANSIQDGRYTEVLSWMSKLGHPGYYLLVALVYALFGPNILLGQNLNAIASALTIAPIYFLSLEISPDPRVARVSTLAFAWLPNSVIWSTQLLKDSIIVLLEVTLILDLVRVVNGRFSASTILRLVLTTVILAEFRFYVPVLIYGSCALAYIVMAWQAREGRRGATLRFVAAVLATALLSISLTIGLWSDYLQIGDYLESTDLYQLEAFRVATMGGDSDFAKDSRLGSPLAILRFLPVGAAYFLAGPLPWEASKLTHYLTWLDIPIWYPALALGFAGILMLFRRRQALPLVGITLGLTLFYSLFQANLGTAYRMRLQVTPFFLISAAYCWCNWRERPPHACTHSAHHL